MKNALIIVNETFDDSLSYKQAEPKPHDTQRLSHTGAPRETLNCFPISAVHQPYR